MLPVIGVTASVSDDRLSFQQKRMYCEAISACGGLPLILPPQEDVSRASQVLSLLDGLLLAGGDDIDPAYYDEKTLPECGLITPIRDIWEMPLCREALHRHLPLLGICRGLQVLNVALGGSLVQDLPSQCPDSPICHQQTQPPEVATHPVRVDAQSRFARIIGAESLMTNSHHHQAVKQLASGLTATAWAQDGVIEGAEKDGRAALRRGAVASGAALESTGRIAASGAVRSAGGCGEISGSLIDKAFPLWYDGHETTSRLPKSGRRKLPCGKNSAPLCS